MFIEGTLYKKKNSVDIDNVIITMDEQNYQRVLNSEHGAKIKITVTLIDGEKNLSNEIKIMIDIYEKLEAENAQLDNVEIVQIFDNKYEINENVTEVFVKKNTVAMIQGVVNGNDEQLFL